MRFAAIVVLSITLLATMHGVENAGADWQALSEKEKVALVKGYSHGVMSTIIAVQINYADVDPELKKNATVFAKIKRDALPESLDPPSIAKAVDAFYAQVPENRDIYIGDAMMLIAYKGAGHTDEDYDFLKKTLLDASRRFK